MPGAFDSRFDESKSPTRTSRTGRTWKRGEFALFEVQDDGIGIPPDEIERVSEPFFTTKSGTSGTGLGS